MDLAGGAPPPEWAIAPPPAGAPRPAPGAVPGPRPAFGDDHDDHDDHDDELHGELDGVDALRRALWEDPLTGCLPDLTGPTTSAGSPAVAAAGLPAARRVLRAAVTAVTDRPPGGAQVTALDTLLAASLGPGGPGLSEREWVEVTCAADRCASHLHAVRLTAVAALDEVVLATRPGTRTRKDSRRPTADALAPALKLAPGSASALVGLARQSTDMAQATDALAEGLMTAAQYAALATVLRRMPDPDARAKVEAIAVAKAATLVRAQLAGALEEAAVQADPGYTARAAAMGIEERDVRLVPSPVPGCQRVLADLERSDAARFFQVLNEVAVRAKRLPVPDPATGLLGPEERSPAQLRADALVSLVVGLFSVTTAQAAAAAAAADDDAAAAAARAAARATSRPADGTTGRATDADVRDDEDDDDDFSDGFEGFVDVDDVEEPDVDDDDDLDAPAGPAAPAGPDPDLPPDTRALVHIPTPQERAHLAEVHVVVLADDLDDDPEDGDPGGGWPGDDDGGPDSDEGGDADSADDDRAGRPDDRPAPPEVAPPIADRPADAASAPPPPRERADRAGRGGWRERQRARRARRALARYRPMLHLPGYGRLDPGTSAAIIDNAPWRRMVADATTGVLVQRGLWLITPDEPPDERSDRPEDRPDQDDAGRARRLALLRALTAHPPPHPEVSYRPSSDLAAFVRARDATCIGPACHHSARSGGTQLDHTIAWGHSTPTRLRGGTTTVGNLGCVCQRIHNAKTHGDWQLQQPTPGTFIWTSPQGLVYLRRATPLLPDLLGDLTTDTTDTTHSAAA